MSEVSRFLQQIQLLSEFHSSLVYSPWQLDTDEMNADTVIPLVSALQTYKFLTMSTIDGQLSQQFS